MTAKYKACYMLLFVFGKLLCFTGCEHVCHSHQLYRFPRYQVPLISTTNSIQYKKRLQFARAFQNWTVEAWKNVAWSDESRFLL